MRRLLAVLVMGWSVAAAGQLSGRFYLEKSTFAEGEPVFLYFEVVNHGPQPENIDSTDPYSCRAGYEIKVSSDPKPTSSCKPFGCFGNGAFDSVALPPRGSRVERVLLNFDHKIDSPGSYEVEATRYLSHGSPQDFYSFSPKTGSRWERNCTSR